MKTVKIKGTNTTIRFPDTMSDSDIANAIQTILASQSKTSGNSGINSSTPVDGKVTTKSDIDELNAIPQEVGWIDRAKKKLSDWFDKDDKPTPEAVTPEAVTPEAATPGVKLPIIPDEYITPDKSTTQKVEPQYAPDLQKVHSSYQEEVAQITQEFDAQIGKIKFAKKFLNEDSEYLKVDSKNLSLLADKKIETLEKQKQSKLSIVYAKLPKSERLAEEQKQTKVNEYEHAYKQKETDLELLENNHTLANSIKKEFDEGGMKMAGYAGVLDAIKNVLKGGFNYFTSEAAKIDEEKNNLKNIQRHKDIVSKYGIDPLDDLTKSMDLQTILKVGMHLEPTIEQSIRNYENVKDEDNTVDDKTIKGFSGQTNMKVGLEKATSAIIKNLDAQSLIYKDNLQNDLSEQGFGRINNVPLVTNSPEFSGLINRFVNNKPMEEIMNYTMKTYKFKDPNQASDFLSYLSKNSNFSSIAAKYAKMVGVDNERVKKNIFDISSEESKKFNALNEVERLNEEASKYQDESVLAKRYGDSPVSSNLKYIWEQGVSHSAKYMAKFTQQWGSELALLIDPDDSDLLRASKQLDLYTGVHGYSGSMKDVSFFGDNEYINIPSKSMGNVSFIVNKEGNLVGITGADLHTSIRGSDYDELSTMFNSNKDLFLNYKKSFSDTEGAKWAATRNLGAEVGTGLIEEVPTMIVEIAAGAVTGGLTESYFEAARAVRIGTALKKVGDRVALANKVANRSIDMLSAYGEIAHSVRQDYQDNGISSSYFNNLITSGALSSVSMLTPSLDDKFFGVGSGLARQKFEHAQRKFLIKDVPKVIEALGGAFEHIKDRTLKDYLINKELRSYVVNKTLDLAQEFMYHGLEEAVEETITEPLAQIAANKLNTLLTQNRDFDKQTLLELGWLDPSTAVVAGLTGGIMSGSVNLLQAMKSNNNELTSLSALKSAIDNPDLFKSFLGGYSGKNKNSIDEKTLKTLVSQFDAVRKNYDDTKKDFNLDEDFLNNFNFDDPAQAFILDKLGISKEVVEQHKSKREAFNHFILFQSLRNVEKNEIEETLLNKLGLVAPGETEKSIKHLILEDGRINTQLTKSVDKETEALIKKFNQAVIDGSYYGNTLNLFNENLGDVQENFKKSYLDLLKNSPDIMDERARGLLIPVQDLLFKKVTNQKRIDELIRENENLALSDNISDETKEKIVDNKLAYRELQKTNDNLDEILKNTEKNYQEGYFDNIDELKELDEQYKLLNAEFEKKVGDMLIFSSANKPIEETGDEEDLALKNLSDEKESILRKIIRLQKHINNKYTESHKSKHDLQEIGGKKYYAEDVVDYQAVERQNTIAQLQEIRALIKDLKGKKGLSKVSLLRLASSRRYFDEEKVKKSVLSKLLQLNIVDLEEQIKNNPELALTLLSILNSSGYITFGQSKARFNEEAVTNMVFRGLRDMKNDISNRNSGKKIKNDLKLVFINEVSPPAPVAPVAPVATVAPTIEAPTIEVVPTVVVPPVDNNEVGQDGLTNLQRATLQIIENGTILRSEADSKNVKITKDAYIINGELFARSSGFPPSTETFTNQEPGRASHNVGNFFDDISREFFSDINLTVEEFLEKNDFLPDTISVISKQDKDIPTITNTLKIHYDVIKSMAENIVKSRDKLVSEGYVFIADERIVFSKFDTDSDGNPLIFPVTQSDGSKIDYKGVAGTTDLLAIGRDGNIKIIDFKTINFNNTSYFNQNLTKKIERDWPRQVLNYTILYSKLSADIEFDTPEILYQPVKYKFSDEGRTTFDVVLNETTYPAKLAPINIIPEESKEAILPNFRTVKYYFSSFFPEVKNKASDFDPDAVNPDGSEGDFFVPQFDPSEAEGGSTGFDPYTLVPDDEDAFEPQQHNHQTTSDVQKHSAVETISLEDFLAGTSGSFFARLTVLYKNLPEIDENVTNVQNGIKNFLKLEEKDGVLYILVTANKGKDYIILTTVIVNSYTKLNLKDLENAFKDILYTDGATSVQKLLLLDSTAKMAGNKLQNNFISDNSKNNNSTNTSNKTTTGDISDDTKHVPIEQSNPTEADTLNDSHTVDFIPSSLIYNSGIAQEFLLTYDSDTEKYSVRIYENYKLDDLFKNLTFTEDELRGIFQKHGFFLPDKLSKTSTKYVLRNTDLTLAESFKSVAILSQVELSDILNSLDASSLEGEEVEIKLIDDEKFNGKFKTKEEFLKKSSIGIFHKGKLVGLVPTFSNNNKPSQIRNSLQINEIGSGKFEVIPLIMEITRIKKSQYNFTSEDNRNSINDIISQIPDGWDYLVGYVGIDKNRKKYFVDGKSGKKLNNNVNSLLVGGVYIILTNKKNTSPVIIPLRTPKLKEAVKEFGGNIEKFKKYLISIGGNDLPNGSIKELYDSFLVKLGKESKDVKQLLDVLNMLPRNINENPTGNNKLKLDKLKKDLTVEGLVDFLLETLVSLTDVSEKYHTANVNLSNLYVDNSVIIQNKKVSIPDSKVNPSKDIFDGCAN